MPDGREDGGDAGRPLAGLDVGGAHVKGARVEGGRVVDAFQLPAPNWTGIDKLENALAEAVRRLGDLPLAVTITAELSDCFPSRREGVARVCAMVVAAAGGRPVGVYAGRAGFLAPAEAPDRPADVASANWHATAALVAARVPEALLVDVGSTTSDVIPVAGGAVAARGYSDAERLAAGELLYTGTTRTFLMAVADRVPFRGVWQPLMNEYFASMADIRRLTGELEEGVDQHRTADGRGTSLEECRERLARMVGRDAEDATEAEWARLARYFAERQARALHDAAEQVLSAGAVAAEAPVVGAGIGAFITRDLARRLGRPWRPFSELFAVADAARDWATRAAPAVAVALLASEGAALPDRG